jgi:hypothetical protein
MIGDAWQSMTYGGAFLAGVFVGVALGMLLLGMALIVAFRVPGKLVQGGRLTWHGVRYLFVLEDGVSS